MLDTKFFEKIRNDLLSYAEKRREVIKDCGDAQHLAKKAIFALQRDDASEAHNSLKQAEKILVNLHKKHEKVDGIFDEGSYKAALEEFVEARLFHLAISGKKIGECSEIKVDSDTYIGGLADVPGELLRYAIKSATEKKFDVAKDCYKIAEEIINEMVDMNLTGYNRQKFDQAKQALHKLQQVVYEVSLRD
jgi:predicted translin family RNA/ssDNA-binding protein